jgi:hypothetical protein
MVSAKPVGLSNDGFPRMAAGAEFVVRVCGDISTMLERSLARRIGDTTTTLPTSHVPQDSGPADVAAVMLAAVDASSR